MVSSGVTAAPPPSPPVVVSPSVGTVQVVSAGVSGAPQVVSAGAAVRLVVRAVPVAAAAAMLRVVAIRRRRSRFGAGLGLRCVPWLTGPPGGGWTGTIVGRLARLLVHAALLRSPSGPRSPGSAYAVRVVGEDVVYERRETPHRQSALRCLHTQPSAHA